jgi:hypothetical protein
MLLAAALARGAAPACLTDARVKIAPVAPQLLQRAVRCGRVAQARLHGVRPPAAFLRIRRLAPLVRITARRSRNAPPPPFPGRRRGIVCRRWSPARTGGGPPGARIVSGGYPCAGWPPHCSPDS